MKIKFFTFNVQRQTEKIREPFFGDLTDVEFDVIILRVQECRQATMETYVKYLTSWAIKNASSTKFTYIGNKIVSPTQEWVVVIRSLPSCGCHICIWKERIRT